MTAGHIDLNQAHDVALAAARRGGEILMEKFTRLERVARKGSVDLVTEADLASEAAIVTLIHEAFPDHAIIAEEGDHAGPPSAHRWVIDPLDGTTNYVHGLPIFAVSIAYQVAAQTQVGIVLNPAQQEEYVAVKGQGATLNGEPLKVSKVSRLAEALLVTGFPYARDALFHRSFDLFRALYERCQGIRRLGAAALDFCYVAAGRFECFYEFGLKSWDVAAGDLICREAGGRTSDWRGQPMPFSGSRIVASNGLVHEELLAVLAEEEFVEMR